MLHTTMFRRHQNARLATSPAPPPPPPPPPSDTPIIMAILAGQSNMAGRNLNDGNYAARANAWQYGGNSADVASYQQITADISVLQHHEDLDRTGPDDQLVEELAVANPAAQIVAVPVAQGSLALVGGPWASSTTPGGGGLLFEFMVDQANAARAAIIAQWPGATIETHIYWLQGEQDAALSATGAAYLAALTDFCADARSRITGAAGAPVIIGSMLPQKWIIGSANYLASYAAINEAHVEASYTLTDVKYIAGPDVRGNNDNLHYQPAPVARTMGTRISTALTDSAGPNVTTAAAQSSLAGSVLAVALTHDDPYDHATFEISGGADATSFEISDPYIGPTLRWTGDGTGPTGDGDNVVEVRARDGMGNLGPALAITVSVSSEVSPSSFFQGGDRGYVIDLNDLSTLFQDREGTIPVTAAGQSVGRANDTSGNGWDLQADANDGTRPTYQEDASGNGYLEFSGAQYMRNDNEVVANGIGGGTAQWTCAVAIDAAQQPGEDNIFGDQADNTASFLDMLQMNTAALRVNGRLSSGGFGALPTVSGALGASPTTIIAASQYDGQYNSGGVYRPKRCRVASASATWAETNAGPSDSFTNTCTKFVLGARYFSSPSNQFTGKIGSFYVIDRALSDTDRGACEAWVESRCTASLAV